MFSDLKSILMLIVVILLIFLVFKILKYPVAQKITFAVLSILLIFSGVFTGYSTIKYFTASGGIVGGFQRIINNEIVQTDYEFNFKKLTLTSENGDNEFTARITFKNSSEESLDITNKILLVNNEPTNTIYKTSNYIYSSYGYIFYDENLTEICSDSLNIKFSFNKSVSECIITTYGGANVVKQWNNYLLKNDFVITLADDFSLNLQEINVDALEHKYIYYYDLDGDLMYKDRIVYGNYPEIQLRNPTDKNGVMHPYWRSQDFKLVSQYEKYLTERYEDLHFYLYSPDYAVVNIKVSEGLINDLNLNIEKMYRDFPNFDELSVVSKEQMIINYCSFGSRFSDDFYFKLKMLNVEEKIGHINVLTLYANNQIRIPNKISFSGGSVNEVEYFEFYRGIESSQNYQNLTFEIGEKSITKADVVYPMFEIKLFKTTENVDELVWAAESGYVLAENGVIL